MQICKHMPGIGLTVYGVGGVFTRLQVIFVKNIGKFYAHDFLAMSLKFYVLTFQKNVKAMAALGSCQKTSSQQMVNFKVF